MDLPGGIKTSPGKQLRVSAISRKKKEMQTSKFLLVIGAVMIFSAPSLLAAKPETEAQIKMREALRLKMEELNAQETPFVPPVVEAPKAPEPMPTPAPVSKPQVKPVAPKPVKVKAEPAKPKTVVVPVPVEAPVAAPAKAEFSEPVSDADSAAAARMEAALQKKMAELDATPAPVAKPKVVVAPEKSAPVKVPAKPAVPATPATPVVVVAPAPTKIEAPASPLPVTKQDRLAELLRRYKADQVTAQDYHSQRAAILSE